MKNLWQKIWEWLTFKKDSTAKKDVVFNQREVMVAALRNQKCVILADIKKMGVTRATRIVNELRKDGWHIKTNFTYVNGKKTNTIYTLITDSTFIGI